MKLKSKEEVGFKMNIPTEKNKLLSQALGTINSSEEIKTLWRVLNVNAIDRLGMTDHGPVHFQIVANIGLRLLRILEESGISGSVVDDFGLVQDHAELIVFLGCILHDIGMSVEREGHEEFSIVIANSLLREVLNFMPVNERTIVTSEVLHSIISHRKAGKPRTIEAGIVRVADALDMSEGRSKIPYSAGSTDIHSLSHAAIDAVKIKKGSKRPIEINIIMNNSAGVFQVDDLMKGKIKGSGIEKYIEVEVLIEKNTEKKLLNTFSVKL